MKLSIEGIEQSISIAKGFPAVLEVQNKKLFSRICQSLLSGMGERAIEPYVLRRDDGNSQNAKTAFLAICNPFDLPWEERSLLGDLHEKIEDLYYSEDVARREIDQAAEDLRVKVASLGLRFQSDYDYAIEWDMGKYLKAFDFSVDEDPGNSLFDNLILFLKFLSDIQCGKIALFVNLKNFLEADELIEFYKTVFFCRLPILLLESSHDCRKFDMEKKVVIDEDFLSF